MKKITLMLLMSIFVLASCSNTTSIPNEDFVNAFAKTNEALIDEQGDVVGEVIFDLAIGINYQSSTLEFGFTSNNDENQIYYIGELSADTIITIVDKLLKNRDLSSSGLENLIIMEKSDEKTIGNNGNSSSKLLNFNASKLNAFYKGNALYLSNEENQRTFGEKLNGYSITSQMEVVNDQTFITTTMNLTLADMIELIPFFEVNSEILDTDVTLKFYQTSSTDLIERIEIVFVDQKLTDKSDTAYISYNLSIGITFPFSTNIKDGDDSED